MYEKEWKHLVKLGWTEDLLPCVQPWIEIDPKSKIKKMGKTPSIINKNGLGAGITSWTSKYVRPSDIESWMTNKDYGICVQTRRIRAIDIDVSDKAIADEILALVLSKTGAVSYRYRDSSSKCLVPVYVEGTIKKHIVNVESLEGNMIEFLGDGNQFVAFGQHPDSGDQYKWSNGMPDLIPTLSEARYIDLINYIALTYGGFDAKLYNQEKTDIIIGFKDGSIAPEVQYIYEQGMVLDSDSEKLYIKCPWEHEHSSETLTSTAYFISGGFKCLHGHCESRNTNMFLDEIGYTAKDLPVAVEEPEEPKVEVVRSELEFAKYAGSMKTDKNGRFKDDMVTLSNWLSVPECPIKIQHDTFTDVVRIYKPGLKENKPLTDALSAEIRMDLQNHYNFDAVSAMTLRDAITVIASKFSYDSAQEWLEGIKWDGVERINGFCHKYFGCKDDTYSTLVGRYMFSSMAGRVLSPGGMVRIVPVFVGTQGRGKTRALRALTPTKETYIDISLGKSDDDLARALKGVLLAEWGECRGMNARDSAALKAYLTKEMDTWIPKYKENVTHYSRRSFLVATANPGSFLNDATGNTRFAPIKVIANTDVPAISNDRDQLWAEARELYKAEGALFLPLEDYIKANPSLHTPYEVMDPWEGRVKWFLGKYGNASIEDLFVHAIGKDVANLGPRDMARLEAIIIKLRTKGEA